MRTSSAAYDLSTFAPEPKNAPVVRVLRKKKDSRRGKRAFLAKCVAYIVLLSVLMAGTVYSKTKLTETKARINSAQSDLTLLESENDYLSFQLESMVSLKNAEEYAVSDLGLVKQDASQIVYVNLQDENRIETYGEDEVSENPFARAVNFVMDFFGG